MARAEPVGGLAAPRLRTSGLGDSAVLASPSGDGLGVVGTAPAHWLAAYDPEQNASAPLGWHRDFADARERLRYWVTACSTRGDRDRPTPGRPPGPAEEPAPAIQEVKFDDRDEEFVDFVITQVRKRQEAEDEFYASLADDEGP